MERSYYNLLNSGFWGWLSEESQPQNPEFRNIPENFHPWNFCTATYQVVLAQFLSLNHTVALFYNLYDFQGLNINFTTSFFFFAIFQFNFCLNFSFWWIQWFFSNKVKFQDFSRYICTLEFQDHFHFSRSHFYWWFWAHPWFILYNVLSFYFCCQPCLHSPKREIEVITLDWSSTMFSARQTTRTSVALFDSLPPINNLSVKQGRVFLGWTSTKLG